MSNWNWFPEICLGPAGNLRLGQPLLPAPPFAATTPRRRRRSRTRRSTGLSYVLGEQFLAAAQDEGTFGEWLDELPFEVAAATARLLKHHARSGAWVELSPGNPSQASRAGSRDRDRSSPNCPSDMSELSENSD